MIKLREYKRKGDAKVVENTTLTTRRTHIGFDTKRKSQYEELSVNLDYYHIVYTASTTIPDMKPVTGTLKLSQVNRYLQLDPVSNHWCLSTTELPCYCPNCCLNHNKITECSFYVVRKIKTVLAKYLIERDEANDRLELNELTIPELKGELMLRGLKLGGRIAKLSEQLSGAFSAEYHDGN